MLEQYLFYIEIGLIVIGIMWVLLKDVPTKPFLGSIFQKVGKGTVSGLTSLYKPYTKPQWYGYHLLIYGSTGKGKSTYVEYALHHLQKALPNAQYIIINPHHRKGQWGLNHCIGGGRDYTEIEQAMGDVLLLMEERYKLYYEDCNATFNDIYIIIDELPAIIANTSKGVVGNTLKQLSSEARKVNLWLVVLSQSRLVKQLGFDRASDMLDNFVFIEVKQPVATYTIDGEPIEEPFKKVTVDISGTYMGVDKPSEVW
jgi:hypothetical protein